MTKGSKKYGYMKKDGNWFAHAGMEQSEKSREACTSTGSMLVQSVLNPIVQAERYPKIKRENGTMGRHYSFSEHDNRAALQDRIETYDHGLGRKKCLDACRQHNSHLCLRYDDCMTAVDQKGNHSAYGTDFIPWESTENGKDTKWRRFPRNHLQRSNQAAVAQAGGHNMWFGRHDLDQQVPLDVLAASNHS
ncbi:testis-expressed protein 36 [Hoplias malabaricus]|uniref:testis-expressed protein 36 n=1 Tax=Hoplias malabaricus TaxID=27720 RepID=UPI0034618466